MNFRKLFSKICFALSFIMIIRPVSSAQSKHFIKNVGQVTDQNFNSRRDIDFKLAGASSLAIFIGTGKIHYQWSVVNVDNQPGVNMYRMDIELLHANPQAKIITEGQISQFERYYTLGLEGAIAHKFARIKYKDIYPNIDWTLYFTPDGKLEYDFIVYPGGNVNDIKIRYAGADLKLNSDGSLTAYTPMGEVKENPPFAYQQKNKKKINAVFVLKDNVLTFSTGASKGTLVIDPVLEWATYYGDSEYDAFNDVVTGKDGYIYAAGSTNSLSNIATIGAFQTSFGGGSNPSGADAMLSKFDSDGNLIWTTYYGGTNIDQATSVTVDTAGNIYIAGKTSSTSGIATTGVHQPSKAGTLAGFDAFIVKFDTTGLRQWGTYFGGTGAEGSVSITLACDANDHIYLAGNTGSANGIATPGAHQPVRAGSGDAFLARFSTAGILDWATYFGGSSGTDVIQAVATDPAGNIYIGGYTLSTDGIASAGTHQTSNAGGTDAFVAVFSPAGQQVWGSYIGGTGLDEASDLTVDAIGNVYVAGITGSISDISSLTAHQTGYGGGSLDIYLAKFNANGIVAWSTYYGGAANEAFPGVYLSKEGKVYLCGTTTSADNIATVDAIKPVYNQNGEGEILLACFDTSGARFYGTYLGGSLSEWSGGITADSSGTIYLTGYTNSTDLTTAGAYQELFGGHRDGYLLKVDMCFLPQVPDTILGYVEICSNIPVTYKINAVNDASGYEWILPSGWSGSSVADSISIIADISGTIKVVAINDCGKSDTARLDVTVKPSPAPVISRNNTVLTVAQTYPSYQWNRNGQAISGANQPYYAVNENGIYTISVISNNGCQGTSEPIEITHLSLHDKSGVPIRVFPNPTKGSVNFILEQQGIVEINDITGRLIQKHDLKSGLNTADITQLSSGLYIIRLYDRSGSMVGEEKLVKSE